MKNRNLKHSDNWATPKAFYDKLNAEFQFDFDPCPYNENDIPEKDGLVIEWGSRNFINPPYSRKLKEAFIKRAIDESKNGKLCVMLLPVSTSTRVFHDMIQPNASEIRFIKGRLGFIGINTKGEYVNWKNWDRTPPEGVKEVSNSGMHDSMVVVFGKI
jgi:site-specific DNA-methyltransferase (adenine-specific)